MFEGALRARTVRRRNTDMWAIEVCSTHPGDDYNDVYFMWEEIIAIRCAKQRKNVEDHE